MLFRFLHRLAFAALILSATALAAEDRYPEDSPEHQALSLAQESLAESGFSLREDYWQGILSGDTGKALRLQFFKRNEYRLYVGVAPKALPPKGKLDLRIFDSENNEVAAMMGEPDEAAVELTFNNKVRTGLFLVLMRIEVPPGPLEVSDVPAVLFYGWK